MPRSRSPTTIAPGYDRDDFGDYDRYALLDASLHEHGCYLSLADDQCYDDPSEVHVDHIVALAEAGRSGLAKSDTDSMAEDPDNLWLLTEILTRASASVVRGMTHATRHESA